MGCCHHVGSVTTSVGQLHSSAFQRPLWRLLAFMKALWECKVLSLAVVQICFSLLAHNLAAKKLTWPCQIPEVGQAVFQKDPAIRLLVLPTFLLLGGSHMKRPRLSVQVWSEFWLLGVSHQYLADAGQLENLIIPTWQHSQIQQIFWLIFQGHSDF